MVAQFGTQGDRGRRIDTFKKKIFENRTGIPVVIGLLSQFLTKFDPDIQL